MRKYAIAAAVLALASTSVILTLPAVSADAPTVVRKTLMAEDAPGGNTVSMVQVTIPPGGSENSTFSISSSAVSDERMPNLP